MTQKLNGVEVIYEHTNAFIPNIPIAYMFIRPKDSGIHVVNFTFNKDNEWGEVETYDMNLTECVGRFVKRT